LEIDIVSNFKKGFLVAASLFTATLMFTTNAAAADKVVVFNAQAAIMSTETAKQRVKDLQASIEFSSMQAKFESLKTDLQGLDKEAKTNGMTWSQEQIATHNKKIEYKQADLQLSAKKLQAEQGEAVQNIMKELAPKAQEILKQIITAEGIGLVLDNKAALFANAEYDITAKVTDALNKAK